MHTATHTQQQAVYRRTSDDAHCGQIGRIDGLPLPRRRVWNGTMDRWRGQRRTTHSPSLRLTELSKSLMKEPDNVIIFVLGETGSFGSIFRFLLAAHALGVCLDLDRSRRVNLDLGGPVDYEDVVRRG